MFKRLNKLPLMLDEIDAWLANLTYHSLCTLIAIANSFEVRFTNANQGKPITYPNAKEIRHCIGDDINQFFIALNMTYDNCSILYLLSYEAAISCSTS